MADQGKEGIFSPLLRRVRLRAALPHIRGKVLDWGCGSGALAQYISPENYVGVDIDAESLRVARSVYPHHTFLDPNELDEERYFDTVVSLAVIEHQADPVAFLRTLAARLHCPCSEDREPLQGLLVLTTPKPHIEGLHTLGSYIGLFSRHASEEHHSLLDEYDIRKIVNESGLTLYYYSTFLFYMNQIFVVRVT